jgi:hypothetical protein
MRNAPMNTSGHGMDRKWHIRQIARRVEDAEARGGRAEGSTIQLRVQLITVGSDCLAAMSA